MGPDDGHGDGLSFERFLRDAEPRIRVALVAAFGPVEGRTATFDALSWAWENWAKVQAMTNPVGYFRVGQTAARRAQSRPFPSAHLAVETADEPVGLDRDLIKALSLLSEQQRLVVMLVHAFGWTIRETAEALDVAPSTVQTHAERGLARLRSNLEGSDVHQH
jgi:DNA-directed RNA polymerase specialized sigma subunit